jgi:hypothetical protein
MSHARPPCSQMVFYCRDVVNLILNEWNARILNALNIYIYIYIERERERERETVLF